MVIWLYVNISIFVTIFLSALFWIGAEIIFKNVSHCIYLFLYIELDISITRLGRYIYYGFFSWIVYLNVMIW